MLVIRDTVICGVSDLRAMECEMKLLSRRSPHNLEQDTELGFRYGIIEGVFSNQHEYGTARRSEKLGGFTGFQLITFIVCFM